MAALALARTRRNGHLSVRQREQLRRAFATAGDALGWLAATSDGASSIETARRNLLTMAKRGIKAMSKDLDEELAQKRIEVSRLEDVVTAVRALAEDDDTTYPRDITYEYTVRDGSQSLATKVHTVTVNDAGEARSTADSIERSIPARGKLADLMVVDLEHQQDELSALEQTLPDFIQSSVPLLKDVIANLQ